jgi:predicted AAA+ superfamily ATPase
MNDVKRDKYVLELLKNKDRHVIKVLTGMRRCGKSTILEQFAAELTASGVKNDQIISVNFEDINSESLQEYHALNNYVLKRIHDDEQKYYLLLDEIQMVPEFEKVINSLFLRKNLDIYITGSNAYYLSGELATLLTGRYIEFKVFPFSFSEFRSVYSNLDELKAYEKFLVQGGMPYLINYEADDKSIRDYYEGIYSTVLVKDVISRKRVADSSILQSVAKFLASNVGNLNTTKRIADTLTTFGRKISVNTLESYISGLVDAMIFYKCSRYDIKGKEYLKTGDKYYIVDIGFRNYLMNNATMDSGFVLENIVYIELVRRGYKVSVGKVGDKEVDFVATSTLGQVEYYQVALTIRDTKVWEREVSALEAIKDNNPKYILHLDPDPDSQHNGIKVMSATNWLLDV